MTREKYLETRALFEERYNKVLEQGKGDNGYVNLYELKKGIREFELFLNVLKHDRGVYFSNIVLSIDGRRRFSVWGDPALKVRIFDSQRSMVERFYDHFERVVKSYQRSII